MADIEDFQNAVRQIQAEQFFEEKFASAPGPSAVGLTNLQRAGAAEDLELLKIASVFCPEDPLGFYEHELMGHIKAEESASSEQHVIE